MATGNKCCRQLHYGQRCPNQHRVFQRGDSLLRFLVIEHCHASGMARTEMDYLLHHPRLLQEYAAHHGILYRAGLTGASGGKATEQLGFTQLCPEYSHGRTCSYYATHRLPCPFQHRILVVNGDVDHFLLTEELLAFGCTSRLLDERLSDEHWCARWRGCRSLRDKINML